MAEEDVPCILSNEQSVAQSTDNRDADVRMLVVGHVTDDAAISDADTANLLANQQSDDVSEAVVTRSRHSSRSRRRRRRHRRRSHFPTAKGKETNFLAAFGSMIVMVCVCTALVEPQWFQLYGGGCRDGTGKPVSYLGMAEFMQLGEFSKADARESPTTKYVYKFGSSKEQVLLDCVSPHTVMVIQCVLAFCFVVIVLSLSAFLFDLWGPSHPILRSLRRNAIFNVLAVLFCVLICGFCFWITEDLDKLQDATKRHSTSRTDVQFSISYYLIAAAGAVSVIASACNLMKTDFYHVSVATPASRDVVSASDDRDAMHMRHEHAIASQAATTVPSTASPPPYSP